jgi:hypothetical protein
MERGRGGGRREWRVEEGNGEGKGWGKKGMEGVGGGGEEGDYNTLKAQNKPPC